MVGSELVMVQVTRSMAQNKWKSPSRPLFGRERNIFNTIFYTLLNLYILNWTNGYLVFNAIHSLDSAAATGSSAVNEVWIMVPFFFLLLHLVNSEKWRETRDSFHFFSPHFKSIPFLLLLLLVRKEISSPILQSKAINPCRRCPSASNTFFLAFGSKDTWPQETLSFSHLLLFASLNLILQLVMSFWVESERLFNPFRDFGVCESNEERKWLLIVQLKHTLITC